ncbi:L-serine ammonia-lyase, iron-sulfur-dependent, subunit alpha [Oscillospiraceae bacterium MB08-C2-2]|nr:L-serine ammonia-lyase, iron-sulfur-dependent, subunit alpha [Oscillospiraceae bacterium MB08-C2-2]
MEKHSGLYKAYVDIMEKELVPAMGCTEPIAISYAAAKARDLLGKLPERVVVEASGNIIKNVKSVVVPNTKGLKGIEAAAAAGLIAGKSELLLEVISQVNPQQRTEIQDYLQKNLIETRVADSDLVFDLIVRVYAGKDSAVVRIVNEHTNIVYMEKNGAILLKDLFRSSDSDEETKENILTVDGILDFAETCDLEDVRHIISRQIEYNINIAEEGLTNDWGANIGKIIMKSNDPSDIRTRARAKAAAGSDARMSGCEMPVVINSGSGNQGITVSVPIIEYAKELGSTEEELYRALVLANLLGLHQKAGIGRLSAYCGAVSAGCASAAGIAYLMHESDWVIQHTVVNCLAITSGIVCDGAKPSCAAKISSAIEASFLALEMAKNGQQFKGGDGIVKKGIENTIQSVAKLGKDGMRGTDKEILQIMVGSN